MKKLYLLFSFAIFAISVENYLRAQIYCPVDISAPANNGGCSGIVNYGLTETVTQNLNNSFGTGAIRCDNGTHHYDNGYYRSYDLSALGYAGSVDIDSISFGVSSTTASSDTQMVFARLYKYSGTSFLLSEFTLLSETPVILNNALTDTWVSAYAGITVSASDTIVVAIYTPGGVSAMNSFIMGANSLGQTDSSYLTSGICAISDPEDYSTIVPNTNLLLNLIVTTQTPQSSVLFNGLASGSVFPLGTTTNTWYITLAPGDTTYCSFDVTVTNPVIINMGGVPADICANQGLYLLTGATPTGGDYYGTNISLDMLDTDTAGIGSNTVGYTYTDANGCNDSASTTVSVNNCVGIEPNNAFAFNVYPNPASSYLNINISGADMVSTNISDLSGRVVISKILTEGNNSLSLTELKPGIYMVVILNKDTGKQVTKKIIKL